MSIVAGACTRQGFDAAQVTPATTAAATDAPLPPTALPRTAPPTPEPTFRAKAGTPVVYTDGWKVNVQKWEEQAPGRFLTPKPGQRLIAVIVRYDNGTPKENSFNPFDWKVQDSAGVQHTAAFSGGQRSDDLHSGSLAPGAFVTGSVQFEVPATDARLVVIYAGTFYKLAAWELY